MIFFFPLLSTRSAPSHFILPPVSLGKKSVLWHRALHMDSPVFPTHLSHAANHFWEGLGVLFCGVLPEGESQFMALVIRAMAATYPQRFLPAYQDG